MSKDVDTNAIEVATVRGSGSKMTVWVGVGESLVSKTMTSLHQSSGVMRLQLPECFAVIRVLAKYSGYCSCSHITPLIITIYHNIFR